MTFGPLEFAAYLRRTGEGEPATVQAARAAAAAPAPQLNRLKVVSGAFAPVSGAVSGEPLVTVFEAIATRTAAGRGPRKPLRVVIRESGPVVVVLSALEPVRWQLVVGPDTELCAVLLAGSGESSVADAREALVKSIGGYYAFRRGHENFRHLEFEVLRATGSNVGRFHSMGAARGFRFGDD